jgi:NTP pyrophosphatase (non-canonical NTP hydrolase)
MINELIQRAYENAKAKGFHEDYETLTDMNLDEFDRHEFENAIICKRISLIHSELGEMTEALRRGNIAGDKDSFYEEGADVLIRMFDLFGLMSQIYPNIKTTLEGNILAKMDINESRSLKHGKKF